MQQMQAHDRYVHLKYHFVDTIEHFAAAEHPRFRTCGIAERTDMRILEGAAMLAAMVGAQALAIGTILIR
jgi:hypothetical protein